MSRPRPSRVCGATPDASESEEYAGTAAAVRVAMPPGAGCTGGTTGAPGQDDVQPDVPGLRQQLNDACQRVVSATRNEVVVIDDHVNFGAGPPTAVS